MAWRHKADYKTASNADIAFALTGQRKNTSCSDFLTKYQRPTDTDFEEWEAANGPLGQCEW
jgi:hypothetical protein